jgi:hypothetical protein
MIAQSGIVPARRRTFDKFSPTTSEVARVGHRQTGMMRKTDPEVTADRVAVKRT